jgi:hypothetical protein
MKFKNPKTGKDITVKDAIADAFLQQILLRPAEYSVVATLNLNGDYISDALAAQVGGIGIAPGANMSDSVAMFEATHGTAPKYAGKDYVNPGSEDPLGRDDAAPHGLDRSGRPDHQLAGKVDPASKKVTYDFARLMDGATQVSCSGFGQVMIDNMSLVARSLVQTPELRRVLLGISPAFQKIPADQLTDSIAKPSSRAPLKRRRPARRLRPAVRRAGRGQRRHPDQPDGKSALAGTAPT